ncbi:MAG: hypothetical protein IPO40_18790 [Fibrobacteres bacterium]|nr:hypothetical protein [Fibrobacterota bacterium]
MNHPDSKNSLRRALSVFVAGLALATHQAQAKMKARTTHPPKGMSFFQDDRDSVVYPTVKVQQQTWMAKNLVVSTKDSWCYGGSSSMCARFGRLYTWEAARKACPSGWHLPSDQEWSILENSLGDSSEPDKGKCLKATSWGGLDEVKFRAMAAGFRQANGNFANLNTSAYFWTASDTGPQAWSRHLGTNTPANIRFAHSKNAAMSVRCIQD